MQFSSYALQRMGYRPISDGEIVAGVFHSLNVYQIRGITTDTRGLGPHLGQVDGISYKVSSGSSMNAVCQELLGQDFAKDEDDWQKFRNCTPPYLAVIFGPTQEYDANGRNYIKRSDDEIETYDSFHEAKAELKRQEEIVLPRLLPALSCGFSLVDQPVRFLPVERAVAGKTREGKTIYDMRITGSMTGYASRRVDDGEIKAGLADAIRLAGKLNAKVARFYHLALYEDDLVKKFLYFFLAIDIETHAAFTAIDQSQMLSDILTPPTRATGSVKHLFDEQRKNWRAVKDRFVWCVVCAWPGLSDSDVDEFTKIKEVRDRIAHGRISVPPEWAVASAERLAAKLQQAKR
jgi:hypothetical protein